MKIWGLTEVATFSLRPHTVAASSRHGFGSVGNQATYRDGGLGVMVTHRFSSVGIEFQHTEAATFALGPHRGLTGVVVKSHT